jgi:hypothetical protein
MRIGKTMAALVALASLAAGADYRGEVRFGGQAVPGAMVTLVNSATKLTVTTDAAGRFEFKGVESGRWTVTAEMPCFAPASREASDQLMLLNLDLLPETMPCGEPVARATALAIPEPQAPVETRERPLVGYLINGSVDNAADSDMAQPAAFGNFRRGSATYYASLLATLDSSALDAAPYSLVGATARPPSHMLANASATLSGPLTWWRNAQPGQVPYFILSYERTRNRIASVANGRVPSAAERAGDFSSAGGQATDPLSGAPFPGGAIPESRISMQAALLRLYPRAGTSSSAGYNLETPIIRGWHRDAWKLQAMKSVGRGSLTGEFSTESARADESTLFGFLDRKQSGGTRASLAWVPGRPEAWQGRFAATFERQYERALPYFADVRDVAGEAGIAGPSPRAADWGPPSLSFSSGVSGLTDVTASRLQTQNAGVSAAESGSFGPWQLRAGFSFTRRQRNQLGLINPRGSFGFTGAATGIDVADFLLGLPDTASLATGTADRYLRANEWATYVVTEWRPAANLTVNAGARWEYPTPYAERYRRLANLKVASGFASAQVATTSPSDDALIRPYRAMVEPRVSLAWLPVIGSSLVVRSSYGIYADTGAYESIAASLAAQPPFGRNFAIRATSGAALTMATALAAAGDALGTFGVDGSFRPGYAQNWQFSVERDLAWGLVAKVGYLGIKGTHARQASYPNTYPAGGAVSCPSCPAGFEYILSGGNSSRHAGQIEVRRRLRGGWSVKSQTTWAKGIDNAALGGGAQPALVAQNWADLASERGLSSFDQRVTERLTADYTLRFTSGWRHRLLDEWRLASDLTIGTGMPLTPVYPQAIGGAGFIGNLRPDYTGAPLRDAPKGLHVNPTAFTAPVAGRWGTAGRNTITGPGQFALNAGLWRTLRLGGRASADLRLDVTNLLNHPTFTRWDTTLGSVLFGRPVAANPMRSARLSLEVRF